MNARQAGTFYLVSYHILLLAFSPLLWWHEVLLRALPLLTQKIMTTEDEWSAKKESGFDAFKTGSLNSLRTERMFCGKALVLLNVFMGALSNDCAEQGQFHTSVPHRTWASYLFVSGLVSRRSVFWFSGGYTKQDLEQTAHCLSVHRSLFCFLYFGFVSGINKCVVITDLIQILLEYLLSLDLPESEAYFPLLTSIFKILWNSSVSSSLLLCLELLCKELPPSHK